LDQHGERTLLAPLEWNTRKRERVRCSSLVDWPVYPRLAHTMRASNDAQCGAGAGVRNALAPAGTPADSRSPCAQAIGMLALGASVIRRRLLSLLLLSLLLLGLRAFGRRFLSIRLLPSLSVSLARVG
jgi:hypothetical protein